MALDFKMVQKDVGPFTPKMGMVLDSEDGLAQVDGREEIKQRLSRMVLAVLGDAPPGGDRTIGVPWVRHPWARKFPILGHGAEPDDLTRLVISIKLALSPQKIPEVLQIPEVKLTHIDGAKRLVQLGITIILTDGTPLQLDQFVIRVK